MASKRLISRARQLALRSAHCKSWNMIFPAATEVPRLRHSSPNYYKVLPCSKNIREGALLAGLAQEFISNEQSKQGAGSHFVANPTPRFHCTLQHHMKALIVIDMQNDFCLPGSPCECPLPSIAFTPHGHELNYFQWACPQ